MPPNMNLQIQRNTFDMQIETERVMALRAQLNKTNL